MAIKHNKAKAICIQEAHDGDTQVILHPEDNDLFIQTGRQVINACRLNISIDVWMKELTTVFHLVVEWARGHSNKVLACYCEPKGTKIILFFVPALGRFDFDLAEELSELNTKLISDFNIGMVEVRQVPEKEMS